MQEVKVLIYKGGKLIRAYDLDCMSKQAAQDAIEQALAEGKTRVTLCGEEVYLDGDTIYYF